MKTMRIRVRGKVQGVGFRYFTQRSASSHNIKGWVRNCDDGNVEILAQGAESAIDDFIKLVAKGPTFATVTRLDKMEIEHASRFDDFRITY